VSHAVRPRCGRERHGAAQSYRRLSGEQRRIVVVDDEIQRLQNSGRSLQNSDVVLGLPNLLEPN